MPTQKDTTVRQRETMEDDKFDRFWDRGDTERHFLNQVEYITIGFLDGTSMVGKLLEWGKYVIIVLAKTDKRKANQIMICKQAIKYIIPMDEVLNPLDAR